MNTAAHIKTNSTAMKYNFSINPDAKIETIYVGKELQPLIVVDNLLANPESVIEYAENNIQFQQEEKDFYPGVRKPLTPAYAEHIYQHLLETFWTVFSTRSTINVKLLSSVLSLTTTPPERLRPIQSVPHFDSYDPNQIAAVHYFCNESHGGTSFYRHKSTGFESLDKQRIPLYAPKLKEEVIANYNGSSSYIDESNSLFERTYKIEAKFNRAIFYRSNILHSGNIASAESLSANPRQGRLTANTLVMIS